MNFVLSEEEAGFAWQGLAGAASAGAFSASNRHTPATHACRRTSGAEISTPEKGNKATSYVPNLTILFLAP